MQRVGNTRGQVLRNADSEIIHRTTNNRLVCNNESDNWYKYMGYMEEVIQRDVFTTGMEPISLYAYRYEYKFGTFAEYALKKRKLLLDIEPTMTESIQVGLILAGLPREVCEKSDSEEVTSISTLQSKIYKIDKSVYIRSSREERRKDTKLKRRFASLWLKNQIM